MAFGKLMDKAKETASRAKEVSLETASRAKEASLETASKVRDSTVKAVSVGKEQVQERLMSFLAEINGLKPVLAECGFLVGDVSVSISLPPEFKAVIEQIEDGAKSVEDVLEENKDTITRTQKTILNSLSKANDLAHRIDRYGYSVRQYELLMSIPPKITAVFKPKIDVDVCEIIEGDVETVCEIIEGDAETFVEPDYDHMDTETHR